MPEKLPKPNKEDQQLPDERNGDAGRNAQGYLKYSGMAVQMGLIILAGAFLGVKLDEHFKTGKIFTAILSLLAVFAALYLTLKDFMTKK